MADGTVTRSVLQMRIVTAISKEPGLSVTEISERVGSSRPAVSRSIHSLREDGAVRVHERKWFVTDAGRREADAYSDRLIAMAEQVAEQVSRLTDIVPPQKLFSAHQAIQDALAPGFLQLLKEQQGRWRDLFPHDLAQEQLRSLTRVVPYDYFKHASAAHAVIEAAKITPQIEDVIGRWADLQIDQASFIKAQFQLGELGGAAATVLRQHHRSIASIADNLFAIRQLSTIDLAQPYLTETAAARHLPRIIDSLSELVRGSAIGSTSRAAWSPPASTSLAIQAVDYYSYGVRSGAEAEIITEEDEPTTRLAPLEDPSAGDLDRLLGAVNPRWVDMRHGAWDTLRRGGPDCHRQAAVSQRELIVQVLRHYIPDIELPPDPSATTNGLRLKARLKVLLGSKSRARYADAMINAVMMHHGQLSAFTHEHPPHERALHGFLLTGEGVLHVILSIIEEKDEPPG